MKLIVWIVCFVCEGIIHRLRKPRNIEYGEHSSGHDAGRAQPVSRLRAGRHRMGRHFVLYEEQHLP